MCLPYFCAALHAQIQIAPNALLGADAAAHLHRKAGGADDVLDGCKIGSGAVLGTVQIHHMKIARTGGGKGLGLCGRVISVNRHLIVITLKQTDNLSVTQVDGR